MRDINSDGLAIVKSFESLSLVAYPDDGGVWTIGWGSTEDVEQGDVITEAEADQRLMADLASSEKWVSLLVTSPLNDNQFSALVSLVFNIGFGNFRKSFMLTLLNLGEYAEAATHFGKFIDVEGHPVDGLIRRRAAEMALFLKV